MATPSILARAYDPAIEEEEEGACDPIKEEEEEGAYDPIIEENHKEEEAAEEGDVCISNGYHRDDQDNGSDDHGDGYDENLERRVEAFITKVIEEWRKEKSMENDHGDGYDENLERKVEAFITKVTEEWRKEKLMENEERAGISFYHL
ncbi:hypothetical protein SLEP1_g8887 [Rubroshorea leprosula]|uniref:Uncharacterized protein n=1 Tax=Rubroshorea leprosula TaxID=152421 RepID=A0AAV5I928_9ROSI|nr:hypothetical protein SLEP1_g8887 [Rubroshorea leprosula]